MGSNQMARLKQFCFYVSCDINMQVRLRISDLQGRLPSFKEQLGGQSIKGGAAYVTATLVSGGDTLGLEVQTTYADTSPAGCVWGEWLTFCIKYRDLPPDAALCLAVWEVYDGSGGPCLVGGTTLQLFSKKGRLKTGPQRAQLWLGRPPCTSTPTTTPAKAPLDQRDQVAALEHLLAAHARCDIPAVPWLDPLTLAEVEDLQQQRAQAVANQPVAGGLQPLVNGSAVAQKVAAGMQGVHLLIDLPTFPHAVLYQQPALAPSSSAAAAAASLSPGLMPTSAAVGDASSVAGLAAQARLWSHPLPSATGGDPAGLAEPIVVLHDPEVGRDNPAELKAQKLARSLTRGVIDPDLKPNSEEKRALQAILKLPPNKPLHADEKALLWRFRFTLKLEARALTKFLQCVDWGDVGEARQAAELMAEWAMIHTADALELLSPSFKSEEVRGHAVSVLQQKDDEELLSFLLQLVQALRYERNDSSRLARFLIARALANPHFAIMLHWYLFTEFEDPGFGVRASNIHSQLMASLQKQQQQQQQRPGTQPAVSGARVFEAIRRQTDMLSQLQFAIRELKGNKLRAARATAKLQELVNESGACGELTALRVPCPLDPNILLDGIVPQECSAFRSAQLPLKLNFKVDLQPVNWSLAAPAARVPSDHLSPSQHAHSSAQLHIQSNQTVAAVLAMLPTRTGIVVQGDMVRCCMIYKKGDDLRQDQFILQMIGLMDRLLKRESLDLRLTPYKVLPTSSDDGLVEYVPSMPLSRVLAEHRTIHRYLALSAADPSGPFGLRPDVVETFVRSAAGYCVVTYLLGVGDRHLDNLLLCSDGRLFHIDFGFILGNDPKPFPPPMKICKEMVEAMGGAENQWYGTFRMYACEAYNILRKHSDLILSLFHLMAGASIEAIRADPEKALLKLQDKFRLELDDEAAVAWMQTLLNESATALMPQIVETTHRWAQYWR